MHSSQTSLVLSKLSCDWAPPSPSRQTQVHPLPHAGSSSTHSSTSATNPPTVSFPPLFEFISVWQPHLTSDAPSISIQWPHLTYDPPSIWVWQPHLTFDPPSISVQRPHLTSDPPSIWVRRPHLTSNSHTSNPPSTKANPHPLKPI